MKDALDELLDRYAPDAGAMWLAAETPDIVPEHPFSPKFRRRMDRLIRRPDGERDPRRLRSGGGSVVPDGRRRMLWSSLPYPSPA